ncbi:hypothetical protein CH35J_001263 [Colletotrichum higginsianum]|uniref:Tat pathway signal sequence n=1 Tax=Colletotrichum higginsianum TaxID=80884 RepID=A0A4V4NE57_9PEZI|nr:hypothetical protein CH35J_001263 [Colletotrichum higginsianum]
MPKSPSGRTTLTTVGRMPVIAEDDSLPAFTHPSVALLPPPPPPCRSTKPKNYGRSPLARPVHPHPSYPPPAYSRSSSRDSTLSTISTRSLLSVNENGSRPGSGASNSRGPHKEKSRLLPITTPMTPPSEAGERKGSMRVARRRSWYRIFLIGILVIGLSVGLSVGLTVGARKSYPAAPADASNYTNLFPSGSFAFNTALLVSDAGCTSEPSTWRCFPDQTYQQSPNGSLATFFWTIAASNSYTYQISSSPNPFAPQFTNETMVLLEGNSYNERLVFDFSLPKTVVPSEPVAADGRAVTCTFRDTEFRATLWTRRHAMVALARSGAANATAMATIAADADAGVKWGQWPGQVEIVQTKQGGPMCKDSAGNAVEVAAGNNQCSCQYANFDLVVQEKRSREWQA